MAIKAGELVHVGNNVLIDRLQTAGPGTLNIPTEKIRELGNYESVATILDTPDLTFPAESLDVSAEFEAILLGRDFATDAAGQVYDLSKARPLDVLGQFKAGKKAADPYAVVGSAVVPYLALDSASYRYGLRENASQNFGMRGDSIFYAGVSAFQQEAAGSGAANQVINFDREPIPYRGDTVAGTRYALAVTLVNEGRRLARGTDYTETAPTAAVGTTPATPGSITILKAVPTTERVRIVYQSAAAVASYPQLSHAVASALRPAAIRGKHIEVRIGGNAVTDRWSSIQSANVDWRVTLERDEEFGNSQVVNQDFDTPEVSGGITIRPRNPQELLDRIYEVTGVTPGEVVGPTRSAPTSLDILLHSPEDGSVLKTLHVPDARFRLPGYSGRVEQKLDVEFPFDSDGGTLLVYKGARPVGL